MDAHQVVVGLDNGGTSNNATVLDPAGRFLVDGCWRRRAGCTKGPAAAIPAPSSTPSRRAST